MSTNELNTFLHSFDRPLEMSNDAWTRVMTQAKEVWNAHINGQDWTNSLDITCVESYMMLVDKEGKLIVQNDSLLNYVKTKQVKAWRQKLEGMALKAIQQGKLSAADRFFTKALKVDNSKALNYYRRAMVRVRLMQHRKALEDLTTAISITPEVATYYLKRAQVYRLLDIDYKAMSDLNRAIKINPNFAEAYDLRGKFRYAIGDKAGGKMDLLKYEELAQLGKLGGSEMYGAAA